MTWQDLARVSVGLLKDGGFRKFALLLITLLVFSGMGFHALTLWLIGESQKQSTASIVWALNIQTKEFQHLREVLVEKAFSHGRHKRELE